MVVSSPLVRNEQGKRPKAFQRLEGIRGKRPTRTKGKTKMKGTIYRTDGTKEEVTIPEKDRLDYLQGIVGGLIEVVNITTFDDEESDGKDLILNEEGLLLDLPPNPWSQLIGFNSIWEAQTFFGDLILIDGCLD